MAEENQSGISEEINSPPPVHSQSPATQVLPPPLLYAPPAPATLASSLIHDAACVATLEGNVASLQSTVDLMAANMAEMMSLLRGPNHAASSSTPPPTHGSTVDPTFWVSPTHMQESGNVTAPAPIVQPVPIPPPAPLPTNFPPEAKTEHEQRFKKIEETVKALQAGDSHHSTNYLDLNLFPDMPLPPKIKVPDFKKCDGTSDPQNHLRHYQGRMRQYWEYEQFVVATFQESLSGPALN
ncbi:hypothetical protein CRG98_004425 [Punica granatum]|uniref:Uncharacterized protein n=1 Tax=Punica granatum TaxID=22663 RepID=A0A2I0L3B7_PUNGR|nr:hypothetical protein CRG98_004425 [Punica granatum]